MFGFTIISVRCERFCMINALNSLNSTKQKDSYLSFKKNNDFYQYPQPDFIKEFPDFYELTYKTEASGEKKWAVGILSTLIPGLGHGINGDWKRGAGFFAGNIGALLLAIPSAMAGDNSKAGSLLGIASVLGILAVRIWTVVDAVKNSRDEMKQFVPKAPNSFNSYQ